MHWSSLLCHVIFFTSTLALWPLPQHFEHGSSTLWLSPDVRWTYKPRSSSLQQLKRLWHGVQKFITVAPDVTMSSKYGLSGEKLLNTAFERMKKNVLNGSFVPRRFNPHGADFEPTATIAQPYIDNIIFEEGLQNDEDRSRRLVESEAYTIHIREDGHTLIQITSTQGGLHALETFAQLFFAHSLVSSSSYTPYAPLRIKDSPKFEHRGLNIDISRNWIPPIDVMRTLEAMAANKLNRLHIHASDAQSWPLEIPSLPELALKGAYSPSQIWTTQDLEDVQRHGREYGVEVFIEIDLPGHTTSIGNAYPHLITARGEHWPEYAVEPPCGQLRLNTTEVPIFIDTLLEDVLPRTSRYSSFFHLGGDELNLNAYLLDPSVRSSSRQVLQPLVQSFVDRVLSHTATNHLTTIMWEEMLLDWNLTLPENIIVQTWRGSDDDAMATVLARGHKVLFGSNSHWYLDCGFGQFFEPDLSNPDTPVRPPYEDYCSPYKNWRHMLAYNPLKDIPQDQQHLVVGGEAHLWGELTDSVNLDGMLWPRVSAAAEVMWSGPGEMPNEITTRRLADMRERLIQRGIRAWPVQMEWCLRHEGGCRL